MDPAGIRFASSARLLLAAALGVALPAAAADTYKWVDERGVVTYSNTPPAAAGTQPQKVVAVGDRVTVYTPDEQLKQAIQMAAERKANPKAPQRAVSRTTRTVPNAAAQQAAYDRCVAERRTDCDALRQPAGSYGSYASDYASPWYMTAPHVVGVPAVPFRVLSPAPSYAVGAAPLPNANAGRAPLTNADAGLPDSSTSSGGSSGSYTPRSYPGGGRHTH